MVVPAHHVALCPSALRPLLQRQNRWLASPAHRATAGPNGCSSSQPCQMSPACATGLASLTATPWFCPTSMPVGAVPAPAGQLCWSSEAACESGPNGCDAPLNISSSGHAQPRPCVRSPVCAGVANAPWFCPLDLSPGASPSPATGQVCPADPGALVSLRACPCRRGLWKTIHGKLLSKVLRCPSHLPPRSPSPSAPPDVLQQRDELQRWDQRLRRAGGQHSVCALTGPLWRRGAVCLPSGCALRER